MNWNLKIAEAPKDHPIIAASVCGVVTKSYWIEKDQRWNMFTSATPPIAWQIWPVHPYETGQVKPKKEVENLENMFE